MSLPFEEFCEKWRRLQEIPLRSRLFRGCSVKSAIGCADHLTSYVSEKSLQDLKRIFTHNFQRISKSWYGQLKQRSRHVPETPFLILDSGCTPYVTYGLDKIWFEPHSDHAEN